MTRSKRGRSLKNWKSHRPAAGQGKLRIIGGEFRGRQIDYSGDPITRPMKDNIREALFNLIGGWVKGKAVFDLFAGTGAIGIEALSRGAHQAYFVERHFASARIIEQNLAQLADDLPAEVSASDTFFWVRKFVQKQSHPTVPWMVFCCPPYRFFDERRDELITMLESLLTLAPPESLMVVESDQQFSPQHLPQSDQWEVRQYSPAQIAVLKLPE